MDHCVPDAGEMLEEKKTDQASRGLWLKQKAGLRCSTDRWAVSTNQRAKCWILLNVVVRRM